MIDVKKAVDSAIKYAKELLVNQNIQNITLEEVELLEDEPFWLVTLGYIQPNPKLNSIQTFIQSDYEKVYKIFKVRSDNGEVVSMKIRKP